MYDLRKKIIDVFKDPSFFLIEAKYQVKYGLTIVSPKQMLQRSIIEFAKVKAGNTFENLLNEICKTIHYLHRAKKILKKYITL